MPGDVVHHREHAAVRFRRGPDVARHGVAKVLHRVVVQVHREPLQEDTRQVVFTKPSEVHVDGRGDKPSRAGPVPSAMVSASGTVRVPAAPRDRATCRHAAQRPSRLRIGTSAAICPAASRRRDIRTTLIPEQQLAMEGGGVGGRNCLPHSRRWWRCRNSSRHRQSARPAGRAPASSDAVTGTAGH